MGDKYLPVLVFFWGAQNCFKRPALAPVAVIYKQLAKPPATYTSLAKEVERTFQSERSI